MYYVIEKTEKSEQTVYCISNTDDGKLKLCTKEELVDMISTGEKVLGVSNNEVSLINKVLLGEKAKYKTFTGATTFDILLEGNNIVFNGEADFEHFPKYVNALGCGFKYIGSPEVKMSDTITVLGENSFRNCRDITSITFPKILREIGDYCFRGCYGLTNLEFPNSLKVLHNRCFTYNKNLTNILLPENLEQIGDKCFMCCTSLVSITLPQSLKKIGRDVFSGCNSLKDIYMSKSLFDSEEDMAKHLGILVRKTNIHINEE